MYKEAHKLKRILEIFTFYSIEILIVLINNTFKLKKKRLYNHNKKEDENTSTNIFLNKIICPKLYYFFF